MYTYIYIYTPIYIYIGMYVYIDFYDARIWDCAGMMYAVHSQRQS